MKPVLLLSNLLALSCLLLQASRADAGKECAKTCENDTACEIEVHRCFLEQKTPRPAIDRLKPLVEVHPEQSVFARLLASAYLADGNAFWAETTLLSALERHPGDCATRAWLAWVYLQGGEMRLASEQLDAPGCPKTQAEHAQWALLRYRMAVFQGDDRAASLNRVQFMNADAFYEDDAATFHAWWRDTHPEWVSPIQLRLDLLGGYTSNAAAGSPLDRTTGEKASAIGRFDLFGRVVLPKPRFVRPTVEGELKGHGLLSDAAKKLSYLDLSIRPGVIIGDDKARALIAYKGNLLLIGLDGKERYYEAHRAEIEFETDFGLLIFSGVGRRIFAEMGRTRTEADGGIAGSIPLAPWFSLLSALSVRRYFAVGAPYDLKGGALLLAGNVSLPKDVRLKIGVTLSVDVYPDSGGERGRAAFGVEEMRDDFSLKQFNEIWSPALFGFRVGLRYAYAYRNSSADARQANYDYKEHRVLAAVRFALNLDPWSQRTVREETHVPFVLETRPTGVVESDADRIQELLRQDEAARAGTACVD